MFPLTDWSGSPPPRLEQLLDVATDGVLALDVLGRPTYVNTGCERLLGRTRQELLGRPLWAELPELEETALGRACQRATGQGVPTTLEEYLPPLGAWLEIRAFPTEEGLLVFLRDVTPRKQVETDYSHLHALVMGAPAVAFVTRGPQHLFELSNPRHRQLHGGHEPLGRPAREAFGELEGQGFVEALERVYTTGEPFVLDEVPLQVESSQGPREERLYHLACQPLRDANQQVDGVAAFAFEVTELVRAREQARDERDQAEEANHTKDEFLATVSHELRTPLTAILGWASIIASRPQSPEKQARALETIERNARALAQMVEDLLDISRIVAGRMRLQLQPLELGPVLDAALDAVRLVAVARDIRLQVSVEGAPGLVLGDPDRLQQVAWNLLTNAIKFTPQGGEVRAQLRRTETHMELEVTDSGQGIPPDFLPHVFERFRQLDGGAPPKQGGLGLGLAIVRHLVELHGGTVEAHSEGEGHGSRFTVLLPLAGSAPSHGTGSLAPEHRGGMPQEHLPDLSGVRVLVVDDEADTRELIRTVLEERRAEVTLAATPEEAYAHLRRSPPDMLVTDIGMPGEDGYAFLRRVRALPPEQGGQVPAAALTAFTRLDDRTRALSAGFQVHVPKPLNPSELVLAIAHLVHPPTRA